MHGKVRIGISGWVYPPWRGVFYPEKLVHRKELAYAAEKFPSIEINGTFYSLQRPSSFAKWAAETPANFVFAIKGPQYMTHRLRLRNIEKPMANFFASGLLALKEKLGPVLWQFPPNFKFDASLIEDFFARLPQNTDDATLLAADHDPWLKGRAWIEATPRRKLRHAMEIRNKSFVAPTFVELLRKYDVAMVCADTVEWPRLMDVTSDFIYCRLHGSEVLYSSGYSDEALNEWAARIQEWALGGDNVNGEKASEIPAKKAAHRDVYVYFDNDVKVRAPFDAFNLTTRVERLFAATAVQAPKPAQ